MCFLMSPLILDSYLKCIIYFYSRLKVPLYHPIHLPILSKMHKTPIFQKVLRFDKKQRDLLTTEICFLMSPLILDLYGRPQATMLQPYPAPYPIQMPKRPNIFQYGLRFNKKQETNWPQRCDSSCPHSSWDVFRRTQGTMVPPYPTPYPI